MTHRYAPPHGTVPGLTPHAQALPVDPVERFARSLWVARRALLGLEEYARLHRVETLRGSHIPAGAPEP